MRDPEGILAHLARSGGRRTVGRQAIIEVLADAGHHITADEVAARVRERFPSVNKSTVYRTLTALCDSGVLEHVHFGHGPATYHLADEDHRHLFCEQCGSVTEVPTERMRAFADELADDYGFRIDMRHFAILGRCGACS
jgi:Fe2+ or Zn2+ uptake regulation protein